MRRRRAYAVELVEESGAADAGMPSEGVGAPGRVAITSSAPDGVDLLLGPPGDEVWHDGAARVRLRLAQAAQVGSVTGRRFPALYRREQARARLLPVHARWCGTATPPHSPARAGPKTTTLLASGGWRPLAETLLAGSRDRHAPRLGPRLHLWQDGLERLPNARAMSPNSPPRRGPWTPTASDSAWDVLIDALTCRSSPRRPARAMPRGACLAARFAMPCACSGRRRGCRSRRRCGRR